jgi:hypothetical protein
MNDSTPQNSSTASTERIPPGGRHRRLSSTYDRVTIKNPGYVGRHSEEHFASIARKGTQE